MSDAITPPFQGFPTAATGFFRELALNQSREWFAKHKTDYERFVRAPLGALLGAVTARLAATPLPLVGDPRRSVFRIHRDVRFGADKSPYKTNASAVWSRDGSKTSPGLIYFHFGANEIFVAAGLYMPMPEDLHRLRAGMACDPEAWAVIRHGLEKRGLTLMSEGALARVPRGFESAPTALHDDLRLKSWVVSRTIAPKTARSPELVGVITEHALACAELLEFGWTALEAA